MAGFLTCQYYFNGVTSKQDILTSQASLNMFYNNVIAEFVLQLCHCCICSTMMSLLNLFYNDAIVEFVLQ